MKTLGEYINDTLGDESLIRVFYESAFDYDIDIDDESIDEGLGSFLGNISGKFNNLLRKVNGFGPKVSNVMSITAKSITHIDDDEEQEKAKKLLESYDNCKDTDDIIKVNVKYLKDNPNEKSKFNTSLLVSTILMIRDSKKKESKQYEKEMVEMLGKQDENIKADLKKEIDSLDKQAKRIARKEERKKKRDAKKNGGDEKTDDDEKTDGTPKDENAAGQEIDDITGKDPVAPLAKKAGIKSEVLNQVVKDLVIDDNGKIYDLNKFDDAVIGLSSIVLGIQIIHNEKFASDILSACGIDYKEFKEKIQNALKD